MSQSSAAYFREYYIKNRQKKRLQQAAWYEENKVKNLEYQKGWREANKERKAVQDKIWRENNLEKIRKRKKQYYLENRDREIARTHKWSKENPLKVNEQSRIKRVRMRGAFVESININLVGQRSNWECGICGQVVEQKEATLDHVQPISKGGKHCYTNVQIAHSICNSRKGAIWPWSKLEDLITI